MGCNIEGLSNDVRQDAIHVDASFFCVKAKPEQRKIADSASSESYTKSRLAA